MWEWARWCRFTLVAAGLAALVVGGVSIFGQPEREILYSPDPPLTVCGGHGCTFIYRLEVSNSGAATQDEVIVGLRRDVVEPAILPVRARNYGKLERRVRVWDDGEVRAYALGPAGVEAPGARVSVGSAGWTMLLRAWLAICRVF